MTMLLALALLVQDEPPPKAKIDKPVKDFKLRDLMQDKETDISLSPFKKKKIVVLFFISYACDTTWRYERRVGALLKDYGKKDVVFLGVRSSANDTPERTRKYAEAKNFAMPVLYDDRNVVADYFNVFLTPTFFVIDKEGILRYSGPCDDSADESEVTQKFVRDALNAVIDGKPVEIRQNEAFG